LHVKCLKEIAAERNKRKVVVFDALQGNKKNKPIVEGNEYKKRKKGPDLCDILQQLHKYQNLRSKCT
jgi:hypothetical protein